MTAMRVVVVIPAYNEERTIADVIRGLKQRGFTTLIVVDDGSSDRTGELASLEGVIRLRHILNRGLGGALGTGIERGPAPRSGGHRHLRCRMVSTILTISGELLEPIEMGEAEVVIGSRMWDPLGMPYRRRLANWTANVVTYLLFGGWTTDSQSGLRAFSSRAATQMQITATGMEVSSEIIAETVRNRLNWKEVPVKAIYTDYSLSKGQSFTVGLRTLMKLILAKVQRSTL